MPYPAYLIVSLGIPRNHYAIFIQTSSGKSGHLFHVTGNVQTGMEYGHREEPDPEISPTFVSRTYLGFVSQANLPRVREVVDCVPAPGQQFHGPKRISSEKPVRRYQEWVKEAIQALRVARVLEEGEEGETRPAMETV